MVKNIVLYIFIYVLFIGCENNLTPYCKTCNLELDAPELSQDENGYYSLFFDYNSIQTFTKLKAFIGYSGERVGWTTNTSFNGCTWGYCEDVPVVNSSGYTSQDGYSYQMLGVYENNIGDTIKVWCGYYDNYGVQYLDSLEVIIK